jgi:hypothetical protein
MKKTNNNDYFKLFLQSNGYDSNKIKYISKDFDSYKVKNVDTGKIGYIRY